jgi:hypothetical protein
MRKESRGRSKLVNGEEGDVLLAVAIWIWKGEIDGERMDDG